MLPKIFKLFLLILIIDQIECARTSYRPSKNSTKQGALPPEEIDPNVSPISIAQHTSALPITVTENISQLNATILDPVSEINSNNTQDLVNTDDPNPINHFCKCTETLCNCCRDFVLPLIPVRGPACARIHYLGDEKMSVQVKYGDIVLASRTVNGKKAAPICVGLPGGFTQFCARIYGLAKEKDSFKSCLSLELRAEDEVEAQLRVSCFKFGTKGFSVQEAEPVPVVETQKDEEDDDDIFGLGGDDDSAENDDDDFDDDEDNEVDDDDSSDYGFRGLLTELFGTGEKKKKISNAETESDSDTETLNRNEENESSEKNSKLSENIESKELPLTKVKKSSTKDEDENDEYDYDSFSEVIESIINIF